MQLCGLCCSVLSAAGELAQRRGQKVRRRTDAPACFPAIAAAIMANFRPEILCSNYTLSGNSFQICPGMFLSDCGIFSVAITVFLGPAGV